MSEDEEKMKQTATANFDIILEAWKKSLPFGQRLRAVRGLLGIDQPALAERLGITAGNGEQMRHGFALCMAARLRRAGDG